MPNLEIYNFSSSSDILVQGLSSPANHITLLLNYRNPNVIRIARKVTTFDLKVVKKHVS